MAQYGILQGYRFTEAGEDILKPVKIFVAQSCTA
jgi:hypothetical protein